jgi:hypothetical protein
MPIGSILPLRHMLSEDQEDVLLTYSLATDVMLDTREEKINISTNHFETTLYTTHS